jgi:hypothetical protein
MAETKKAVKAVSAEETKEIDFGELELKIAKPTLNSDKTILVSGNFTELGKNIQKVVDRYKGTVLTEDNVDYVKTLKKQFVSLRTGIERERKEYKKVYIDPAENLLKSMCDELLRIVDEGEKALGDQLDEYDQRRKNELTEVLNDYVKDAISKYQLREEYAAQIQLKKEYYNKTQKEEDSIDDINAQAEELSRKQKEYDAGVALIQAECEGTGFVPDTYIRELQYKSSMEILLEIKADKKAREEMKSKLDAGEKVTIGEPLEEELAKAESLDSKEEKETLRERVLRVRYKPEQAKLMADFFKKNSIQFEFIKTDF